MAASRPSALPELLAPAGDAEALQAAITNGADAVYFGLGDFNARYRATNFSLEQLPETMQTLHRHGVRGYVAFNTLIFSDELPRALETLIGIIQAGVDAVIVQDLGIVTLIRRLCPELPIHGSTQMTLTEPRGIEFVRSLGVERVILARELSLAEMTRIRARTDLPLEVFVHGALCVAYSGQCLTSESFGGRSANRGQCAQACRQPYEILVDGQPRDLGDKSYLLSPQDLAGYPVVDQLAELGIASLKIEGRLKSAQYVAATTQTYRAAIDAFAQQQPFALSRDAERNLVQSFSRGFSTGFLQGINHQALVQGRFPKHRGVKLGVVTDVQADQVTIRLEPRWSGDLSAGLAGEEIVKRGDGIVFDEGHPEQDEQGGRLFDVLFVRPIVTASPRRTASTRSAPLEATSRPQAAASDTDWHCRLTFGRGAINPRALTVGALVWKSDDPAVRQRLEQSYQRLDSGRRWPVNFVLQASPGRTVRITATIPLNPVRSPATADTGAADTGAAGTDPAAPINRGDSSPAAETLSAGRAFAGPTLSATVESSETVDLARKHPLTQAVACEQLGRLGQTPFSLAQVQLLPYPESEIDAANSVSVAPATDSATAPTSASAAASESISHPVSPETGELKVMIPKSMLNDLRRQAVEQLLLQLQAAPPQRQINPAALSDLRREIGSRYPARTATNTSQESSLPAAQLTVLVRSLDQLHTALDWQGPDELSRPETIYCDFEDVRQYKQAVLAGRRAGRKVCLATPRIIKPTEDGLLRQIDRCEPDGVLIRNLAGLDYFARESTGRQLIGDYSLNIANELTAALLCDRGLHRLTTSYDLSLSQLTSLLQKFDPARLEVVIHQQMPMFHMEHCVFSHLLSDGTDWHTCGRPCDRHQVELRDHVGEAHPLVADVGCRNTVFNARAQSAARLLPKLRAAGVITCRVELLRQSAAETVSLLDSYASALTHQTAAMIPSTGLPVLNQLGVSSGTFDFE